MRAEELAPESVRTHIAVRECIRELVLIAGRNAPAELLELAERADALSYRGWNTRCLNLPGT
ncbi:hypothetical protein [Streptomyces aureus]|uniref:hypothetical protein n=1 Tax=Streptomyces aureus TaxID=193461 RepID=UPI00055E03FB|nr:hypothetical protein [Streptomyces aureus]